MIKGIKFFIFLVFVLVFNTTGFSQISPGDLVEAHAHLEGMSNCTECHELGEKVTNQKCLDCHVEIKSRVDQNKGYHASVEVKNRECASCHNDHHGRNFEIIRFKTDTFNHKLTNYELLGKHTDVDCQDCHKKDFISDPEILKLKNTYLGLSQECLNCHADYHQETLSNNCIDCHDYDAFKPALGFDHNNTDYKLKGKHFDLDCVECHAKEIRNGQNYQAFFGIEFDQCTDCHEDVHRNKFGQNCTECHTENSFLEIKKLNSFNHDLTDYPLKGLHQAVDCKVCHTRNLTDALPYQNCTDCHDDDHNNELDNENKDPDCAACHTVNGFTPSTYSFNEHEQSKFPLNGAHQATPCFSCHLEKDDWKFREIGLDCIDCHEDIHKEFLAEKFYPEQDCKACHIENQWKKIDFDHNRTEFELKGEHIEQKCGACHFPTNENGIRTQNFNSFSGNCIDCHSDIHYQQFEKKGLTDCTACHGFDKWTIADFDHSKTLYPIDGEHEKVNCKQCHLEISNEKGTYINYKIKEFKCADCHS